MARSLSLPLDRPSLYLIDGSSYLYRAYFALPFLSNSRGIPTHAAYGFTRMLMKIIKEHQPQYMAVAFDVGRETFRTETYREYKAQRPSMPDELAVQIPYIKEILRALRIPILEMENYEADDVIATLAKRAEKAGFHVVIVTGDKDMLQLVTEHIQVYDPMKEIFYGPREVVEKMGVPPQKIPDLLGLAGDSIDNIPGVKGIGTKSALELIKSLGTLEEIYAHLDRIPSKYRKKLEGEKETAFMSKALVKVRYDLPLEITWDQLERKEPDYKRLRELFRELEFSTLIRELPQGEEDRGHYNLVTSLDQWKGLVEKLSLEREVSFDFETDSLFPVEAHLVGLAVTSREREGWYVPLNHTQGKSLPEGEVLDAFSPLLEDPEKEKVGQNIKYELVLLFSRGYRVEGPLFDTMVASYLLNPGKRTHGLDDLALEYLGYRTVTYKEVTRKGKKEIPFSQVQPEKARDYACEDADITLRLKHILEKQLAEEGLDELFRRLEMPLVPVLARMELAGVKVDKTRLETMAQVLEVQIERLEKEIHRLAGEPFNINSPRQLAHILFEKLKLKPIRKTKTGYSTDVEVLAQLSLEHPLPEKVLEYRQLTKLRSTYVEGLMKVINPKTGRVHTSFNQTVTATGRLSSSEPNLQNIPIRTELGRMIREAFVAEEGYLLLSADYSQIELRILAALSGDEKLLEAFSRGEDIHTRTACEIFGVTPQEVTPELRRRAKVVNFGIIYGMSPYGLSQELKIPVEEAAEYIERYFHRYPRVRSFLDSLIKEAQEKGYVTTLLGRRRFIPEIHSSNRNTRELGKRYAINTPIQGSAADLIKLAMIRIDRFLLEHDLKTRMILQVHDELLLEVAQGELDLVRDTVKDLMEGVYPLKVPLVVHIGVGKNWEEAH